MLEDAFLEWSVREREPFEDFVAATIGGPGFEPWNLRLVTDADGAVVGVTVVFLSAPRAYVDRIATRKDQRGRGHRPGDARRRVRGRRASTGPPTSALNTDSRTGALGLYEKVGMAVTPTG